MSKLCAFLGYIVSFAHVHISISLSLIFNLCQRPWKWKSFQCKNPLLCKNFTPCHPYFAIYHKEYEEEKLFYVIELKRLQHICVHIISHHFALFVSPYHRTLGCFCSSHLKYFLPERRHFDASSQFRKCISDFCWPPLHWCNTIECKSLILTRIFSNGSITMMYTSIHWHRQERQLWQERQEREMKKNTLVDSVDTTERYFERKDYSAPEK